MALSAGTAFITILPNMAGFVAGLQRSVSGLSTKIGAVGSALTRSLTVPIVGVGIAATKMASDFETSMQHMEGLVGISQKQINQWSDDILKLGGEVAIAPRELAEAMYFITSAGFEGSNAMKVLDASARAAAAGLGETKVVADAVTSAVNAYGEKALSAADATDILVNTVKLGKAEAESIAPVLGSILPTASELGVTFADVAASIAAMTRTGDSAATAATKTNAIFSAFIKTTQQQADAFKKAGYSGEELRRSLAEKGLLPTLLDLRDAVGGNVEALGEMFPNVRALRGVLSLTGQQASINTKIFDEMANSTGQAAGAFASAADTSEFRWHAALARMEAAAISFGNILLPIFEKLSEGLATFAEWLESLDPSTKEFLVTAAAIAAAVGPIVLLFSKLILVFSPVGAVITLISGAVALLVTHWEELGPIIMPVVNAIKDGLMLVWHGIERFAEYVWGLLQQIDWKPIFQAVVTALEWMWGVAKKIWDNMVSIAQWAFDQVGRILGNIDWSAVWNGAVKAVNALWDAIKFVYNLIKDGIVAVGRIIGRVLDGIDWNSVARNAKDAWDGVVSFFGGVLKLIGAAFRKLGELLSKIDWEEVGRAISTSFSWVVQAFKDVIKWGTDLWNALKPVLTGLWEYVKTLVGIVWDGLVKAWEALWHVIKENILPALKNLWDAFMSLWDPLLKGIVTVIGLAVAGFVKLAGFVLPIVIRVIGKVIEIASGLIKVIAGVIDFLAELVGAILGVAGKIIGGISKAIGAVVDFIKDAVSRVGDVLYTIFVEPIKKIIEWIGKLIGHVKDALTWLARLKPGLKLSPEIAKALGNSTIGLAQTAGVLPKFAEGGIAMAPTVGVFGEAGPEALVPLDRIDGLMASEASENLEPKEVTITNSRDIAVWLLKLAPAGKVGTEGMSYR